MKKKILKNVAIISFALFGLGIIGNNLVSAYTPVSSEPLGAEITGYNEVTCKCGVIVRWNVCRANNWGSTCHTGSEDCTEGDTNCGWNNEPEPEN